MSAACVQHRVDLLLEGRQVDLHAVEHRAPVPHDRRHRDGLADFLVGRAIGLGGGGVEIDAVLAGDLRGDREADQLLGLAVERGVGIELHRLEFGPGAGDADFRERLEEASAPSRASARCPCRSPSRSRPAALAAMRQRRRSRRAVPTPRSRLNLPMNLDMLTSISAPAGDRSPVRAWGRLISTRRHPPLRPKAPSVRWLDRASRRAVTAAVRARQARPPPRGSAGRASAGCWRHGASPCARSA